MELPLALAIYFICWWMTLFMVLPFGVHTQQEEGDVVPGSAESAPHNPHIWKKLGITTLAAFVMFGIVYAVVATNLINFDQIPFLTDLGSRKTH